MTTADTAQASTLSLLAYAQLTRPVHAFLNHAPTLIWGASQLPFDVALGLQPRTTTQLQGNELRPRAIHYADDTVLLFPQLPFLLCLLFFDALSHHLHVFLFLVVSVDFEVEMASHDETAAPDQPAG